MTKKRSLFYPCAGGDIDSPVRAFSAIIDEFWFIDVNYYARRLPNLRGIRIENESTNDLVIGDSKLVLKNRCFRHPHFNHMIHLNFVTGDGECAFAELYCGDDVQRELSVFFHRGDSSGESGSNVFWLHDTDADGIPSGRLRSVLTKLSSPGFVCTDGSNAIDAFRVHFNQLDAPHDTHAGLTPFDCHGSVLSPIGTLDIRYGPTVVYQAIRR